MDNNANNPPVNHESSESAAKKLEPENQLIEAAKSSDKGNVKSYFRQNHLQILELIIITLSAVFIWIQLSHNSNQNNVSIRGQLYETEAMYQNEGRDDDILNSIWTYVPDTIRRKDFSKTLLLALTKNETIIESNSAIELFEFIWGSETLLDTNKRAETKNLRKIYLYTQSYLYHIHNAFDYWQDGILLEDEWKTWKGIMREMSAHPIFITTIYQGYKYNYFSKDFAQFVFDEICTLTPKDLKFSVDSLDHFRDREFIEMFYPEMIAPDWPKRLPSY